MDDYLVNRDLTCGSVTFLLQELRRHDLTYSLFGFVTLLQGHTNLGAPTNRTDVAGQIVLASVVFLLIWWGGQRSRLVPQA
jgi:hypothetical protein